MHRCLADRVWSSVLPQTRSRTQRKMILLIWWKDVYTLYWESTETRWLNPDEISSRLSSLIQNTKLLTNELAGSYLKLLNELNGKPSLSIRVFQSFPVSRPSRRLRVSLRIQFSFLFPRPSLSSSVLPLSHVTIMKLITYRFWAKRARVSAEHSLQCCQLKDSYK